MFVHLLKHKDSFCGLNITCLVEISNRGNFFDTTILARYEHFSCGFTHYATFVYLNSGLDIVLRAFLFGLRCRRMLHLFLPQSPK